MLWLKVISRKEYRKMQEQIETLLQQNVTLRQKYVDVLEEIRAIQRQRVLEQKHP